MPRGPGSSTERHAGEPGPNAIKIQPIGALFGRKRSVEMMKGAVDKYPQTRHTLDRLDGHVYPQSSLDHRAQPDIAVLEADQKLSLYIWVGMLAVGFRVQDPRIKSLSAIDLPHPTRHTVLRLRRRKLC